MSARHVGIRGKPGGQTLGDGMEQKGGPSEGQLPSQLRSLSLTPPLLHLLLEQDGEGLFLSGAALVLGLGDEWRGAVGGAETSGETEA